MGLTNFPNGITSFGVPVIGSCGFMTQGTSYFVKPSTGSNSNDGKSPDTAVKTLAKALELATANKNDVVYLFAESNTAASTTDYQSSTLDWNKNMVHLIGINAGNCLSQRSRVAFISTYATASNLFTLSASGCLIANIEFFAGVADVNPTGCFSVTGTRNHVVNCMIAGIGNNANDIAGAYSLSFTAAQECLFEDCMIGLQTIDAGTAANSEILMASSTKNIKFKGCTIYRRIEHATNHPLVKMAAATSIDGLIIFEGCAFISVSTNDAYSNASPFKFAATPTQGKIIIGPTCYMTNGTTAGKWDTDANNYIIVTGSPTPAADTAQIGRYV
jgi:hypothetical protein